MGKYFGTDGFRGEAGITLTADHAYKVGRFLGWYYNALRERNGDTDPARIAIGKDTRRSSYMFEYSLVAGLTASGADAYADPALRFAAMRYLNKQNIAPSVENYEILYRGNLPEGKRSVPQAELLEQLYQKFNFARPMDYHGHSLSVSDVIMLNQDGKISAHYVDSIGFKELPGFLDKKPERTSVLQTLKEKCDAPECAPTVCRKARDAHEL